MRENPTPYPRADMARGSDTEEHTMSDDSMTIPGDQANDPAAGGAAQTDPPEQQPDLAAEAAKWKALARKHEAQAKANAEAAAKLRELEMAGKSETEKLQAMLEEERRRAQQATVEALKLKVAAEKELPAKLVKFLPDFDNEVDMMQAADELLEAIGGAGTAAPQPTRQAPKSNLTTPLSDDDAQSQIEKLAQAMAGGLRPR